MLRRFSRTFMTVIALFNVIIAWNQSTDAQQASTSNEKDDITNGEQAVLASLVVRLSEKGQSLCVQTPVACVGPDRDALGMSLIAARNTQSSLHALAGLVRYRLDGGPAEDYGELLVAKGNSILPALHSLNAEQLRNQCVTEVSTLIKASGTALGAVQEDLVCRSAPEIKTDVQGTIEAIRHNRKSE